MGGKLLGIGDELKRTREEKGLSIYDIENKTKIKATFIEAIEKEEFEKIPGRVYVKGFVKNYAKFLGMDSNQLLQKLNKHFQEGEEEDLLVNSRPQLVRPIKENRFSGKFTKIISIILILCVLGFGGYKGIEYFSSGRKAKPQVSEEKPQVPEEKPEVESKPEKEPVKEPEKVPEIIPKPEVTPEPAKPEPVEPPKEESLEKIELEILMSEGGPGIDSCWIQVILDGKLEFEQTILAGREPMKFTASKSIDITYGNAAAIRIKVNGKDQGVLGAPGEVATKRITEKDL